MKILLAGATGLVGRHVLEQALTDPRVAHVVALSRRPLPAHPKLDNPTVDFASLPSSEPWWSVAGVVCALGTTMRQAGSKQAFRRVDHDYPLAVAQHARARGAIAFALNSSMGASIKSNSFYLRTKGEVEAALSACGYPSLTIVRPGLLGGHRADFRLGERLGLLTLRLLGAFLPRRYRISPADRVARALLDAALSGQPGTHIIESEYLSS
jgi:uncharacterized protein YbjT (DUF2867 family)